MQEYLSRTRLGAAMDRVGGAALLLVLNLMFFVLLWGVRLSALLAGIAAFVLSMILRERTRKRRFAHKERQLRRRVGGEMKMEQWLVTQPRRAHFEAALLLSQAYSMTLEHAGEEGALCTLQRTGEAVLIACAQLHPGEKLTARDIAAFQRACLKEKAERGALCGAGGVTAEGRSQAKNPPRITLIGRERMIALAGAASPATDEQLVALGKRKKYHPEGERLRHTVFQPERASRYLFYGLMLCYLYFLFGSWFYLWPGCACLAFMALCRTGVVCKNVQETL